jgi:hypothetical protein
MSTWSLSCFLRSASPLVLRHSTAYYSQMHIWITWCPRGVYPASDGPLRHWFSRIAPPPTAQCMYGNMHQVIIIRLLNKFWSLSCCCKIANEKIKMIWFWNSHLDLIICEVGLFNRSQSKVKFYLGAESCSQCKSTPLSVSQYRVRSHSLAL